MPQNSDVLHEVLTTILHAYRSPGHAFGSGHKPESWASYGDLTQKLLGLIARAGEIPSSVDDLDENDQGKLKATLSNELQLAEKHAEAVIHAQCKFMQAVAQAAVDAVEEVSDVLSDKDATVDEPATEDAPKAGTPSAEEGAQGVPEAQDAPSAPAAPSDPSNPPAPNADREPVAAPSPDTFVSGPEVLPEPAPAAEDAPEADAPISDAQSDPAAEASSVHDDASAEPGTAPAPEDVGHDDALVQDQETDSPSAPEPSEEDLAGIPSVDAGAAEHSEPGTETGGTDGSSGASESSDDLKDVPVNRL